MKLVCGIDEAGRGPLAGPVTAAAVILNNDFPVHLLDDSKKLTPRERLSASRIIMERAISYGIGWAWPEEIDRINILNATLRAMYRAYIQITVEPHIVLVDGNKVPSLPHANCRAIVKGDSKIPAIQAASILAKQIRDSWMIRYSWIERNYGFDEHKGYPTLRHRKLCRSLGLSSIHRKSFKCEC